ncbi:MAG: hypothetical protein IPK82_31460 [Polyangiaceae bacterium]|nr:hypothetical protein [Polyangiaceae bacterium]
MMERETALKVNPMLVDCYFKLHETIDIVRQNSNEEEFQAYCAAVGKVLGYLLLDVLEPIYAQNSDLRPDLLK